MNINKLKTDSKKELEGVWVDAGEGLRLLIARSSNASYRKYLVKYGRRQDPEAMLAVVRKGVAKHVLLGWENLQEEDKDVSYSSDKAEQLFKDIPDFLDLVLTFANDVELYRSDLGN